MPRYSSCVLQPGMKLLLYVHNIHNDLAHWYCKMIDEGVLTQPSSSMFLLMSSHMMLVTLMSYLC